MSEGAATMQSWPSFLISRYVSRRPRLVAKRQLTVFGREFDDELARRCFCGVDLTKLANVPATPLLRNRNGIAQL